MKRWIALLFAVTVGISAAGCSNKTKVDETTPKIEESSEDLFKPLEGEITVACYDSVVYKDFLENASKVFEEKYSGTKINIDAVSKMPDVKSSNVDGEQKVVIEGEDDAQGQMDYINKANTALMSGGGADIFAMDVLPYYKYAENGQLEDLQKYMDNDDEFQKEDYRMNVIDSLKYKGGQYIFPLDYAFYYYDYDKSLFNEDGLSRLQSSESFTLDELFEISEKSKVINSADYKIAGMKGYTNPANGTNIFNEMFFNNYSNFIDIENKAANFTDGTFKKMLDKIKTWEDNGYILQSNSAELSLDDFSASSNEQYYYKLKYNIELLTNVLRDLEGWEISIPVAGVLQSTFGNDAIAGLGKGEDGSVLFSYSQAYGINANSKNKSLAWEFIKFMASQEIQQTLQFYPASLIGLPIHNEARMVKAKDGIIGELFMQSGESSKDKELTEKQQSALDEYVSTVEKFSDVLNTYPIKDVTINDIVNSEVKIFFEGKVSSEDAAKAIQSKVNMYLNE